MRNLNSANHSIARSLTDSDIAINKDVNKATGTNANKSGAQKIA